MLNNIRSDPTKFGQLKQWIAACTIGAFSACVYSEYVIIESGRTCNRITTKEECEQAAQLLGFSGTTAAVQSNGHSPSHCHWWTGGPALIFNTNFAAGYDCKQGQQCICRGSILGKSHVPFGINASMVISISTG